MVSEARQRVQVGREAKGKTGGGKEKSNRRKQIRPV